MKRIAALIIVTLIFCESVFAADSVLGNLITNDEGLVVGTDTTYTDNTFYSTQSGVGRQNEHYYTYKPNENIVPALYNGRYMYGRQTLSSATDAMRNEGLIPLMGMNAGFFSFQTGVPMADVIENGIIIAKEREGSDAIGFYEGGKAVADWLKINSFITAGGKTLELHNINKYRQPYGLYLLNDRFYSDTRVSDEGIDVVIGSVSGELRLGETVTGVVESKGKHSSAISIPEGKMVLTIADEAITNGYREWYEMLESLNEGDSISITNTVANPNVWNSVSYAAGSVGGRLIKNGVIQDIDEAASPRTAVGIKADGSVVFYTIDGRQSSSYGVRLQTLAQRLKELGCVEAINFDGGGSTTLNGMFPGDWHSTLLNSPSDGSQRACTNFFVLLNKSKQTSKLDKLYIYPYNGYYLTGETENFSVKGVDSGYYPASLTGNAEFSVDMEGCTIDSLGKATFIGNGVCTVKARVGDIESSVKVNVVDSPDDMVFQNENGWKNISSLTLSRGERAELSVVPYYKHTEHFAKDELFDWKLTDGAEKIAYIDGDGTIVAGTNAGSGNVLVTFGNFSKKLPITVTNSTPIQNGGNISDAIITQNENTVTIQFKNKSDVPMQWATAYVDGEKYAFMENGSIVFDLKDENMHKIKVLGDTVVGGKTLAYYTAVGEAWETSFNDISSHWCKDFIAYMYGRGLTDYSFELDSSHFRPDENMTRLDFAVMTCKTLGYDASEYVGYNSGLADADDIPESAKPYINALVANGIVSGKGTDSGNYFAPFDTITRAEVAAIVGRSLPYGIKSGSTSFKDSADIPAWAADGFNVLTCYGVISGYPDGTVRPSNNITRAECAKVLYEIY